jgi:hypothetical protein
MSLKNKVWCNVILKMRESTYHSSPVRLHSMVLSCVLGETLNFTIKTHYSSLFESCNIHHCVLVGKNILLCTSHQTPAVLPRLTRTCEISHPFEKNSVRRVLEYLKLYIVSINHTKTENSKINGYKYLKHIIHMQYYHI